MQGVGLRSVCERLAALTLLGAKKCARGLARWRRAVCESSSRTCTASVCPALAAASARFAFTRRNVAA